MATRFQLISLGVSALFCFTGETLIADTFVLKSGGQIEGSRLPAKETGAKPTSFRVKTGLGVIELAESQVERVIAESPAEKQYRAFLLKMPETLDGNWKMSEWCRTNDLPEKRELHLHAVIALDPDHEAARRALGFSKVDGDWRKPDEYMRSKGYVRHKGAWKLPQEILIATQAEEIDSRQKEWRKKLRMWRGWFGEKRGNEGLANIRAIDDPLAALALAEMLLHEKDSEVKLLYIDVLSRLPSATAVGALIQASIYDNDDTIRDACLTKLAENGAPQAVAAYTKVLKSVVGRKTVDAAEQGQVNRAGEGLGRMRDPHSVKTLIDALVVNYKMVVSSGSGNIGAEFGGGSGGGGGLSAGGNKPVVVTQRTVNQSVLSALRLITEQNFGDDVEAWKRWYAQDRTPPDVDLRRGGF